MARLKIIDPYQAVWDCYPLVVSHRHGTSPSKRQLNPRTRPCSILNFVHLPKANRNFQLGTPGFFRGTAPFSVARKNMTPLGRLPYVLCGAGPGEGVTEDGWKHNKIGGSGDG